MPLPKHRPVPVLRSRTRGIVALRQSDDALHECESVFSAVIDLAQEQLFGCFQIAGFVLPRRVHLGGEEIQQPSVVIVDGTDVELIPERSAILAIVYQFHRYFAFLRKRSPNLANCQRIGFGPL